MNSRLKKKINNIDLTHGTCNGSAQSLMDIALTVITLYSCSTSVFMERLNYQLFSMHLIHGTSNGSADSRKELALAIITSLLKWQQL